MKRYFSIVIVALLLFFFGAAGSAHALGLGDAVSELDKAVVTGQNNVGLPRSLPDTIATVVKAVLSLVGTIFLVLTIYAGILWMTAQGEEDKIETAQKIIKATIIGLFITLAAYAITAFVAGRLSGTGGGGGVAPQPPSPSQPPPQGAPCCCKVDGKDNLIQPLDCSLQISENDCKGQPAFGWYGICPKKF